jgi:hypothetical protein
MTPVDLNCDRHAFRPPQRWSLWPSLAHCCSTHEKKFLREAKRAAKSVSLLLKSRRDGRNWPLCPKLNLPRVLIRLR